jgi:hypothetical protein
VRLADAGGYAVVIANNYGRVTSAVATFTVTRPPLLFDTSAGSLQASKGFVHLNITGLAEAGNIILYASTNLVDWKPVFTNPPVLGSWNYQEAIVPNRPRFYRVSEGE